MKLKLWGSELFPDYARPKNLELNSTKKHTERVKDMQAWSHFMQAKLQPKHINY